MFSLETKTSKKKKKSNQTPTVLTALSAMEGDNKTQMREHHNGSVVAWDPRLAWLSPELTL